MKTIKYILASLLTAFVAVGFSSCTDDDNYSTGAVSEGAYFPEGLATSVRASNRESVYSVPVNRTSVDAPTSYNVSYSIYPKTDGIKVPSSVSFSGSDLVTTLPITYDVDAVDQSVTYDMVITLEGASEYGESEYTLAFQIGAPLETVAWDGSVPEGKSADGTVWPAVQGTGKGTGTYYYNCCDLFGLGTDPGLPIHKEYDPENPHEYDLVIEHWLYNVDFTIHVPDDRVRNDYGELVVRVPLNYSGYDTSSYGSLYCAGFEVMQEWFPNFYAGYDVSDYSSFDPNTGVFYMAVGYIVSAGWYGYTEDAKTYDLFQLDGYPDTTITAEYLGLYTNTSDEIYAIGQFTTGSDVASVRAALVDTTDESVAEQYVIEGGDGVQEVETGKEVRALFPVSKSGTYLLTAVSYDTDANPVNYTAVKVKVDLGSKEVEDDSADWISLGTGEFVDGWFTPLFMKEGYDYTSVIADVEIQRSKTDATLYRMVEPFTSSESPLLQAGINQYSGHRNIQFSIEPMSGSYLVTVMPQASGFKYEYIDTDELYVLNAEGYNVEAVEAEGEEIDKASLLEYLQEKGAASEYYEEDGLVCINTSYFYTASEYGTPYSFNASGPSYIAFPESSQAARHKARAKSVAKPRLQGLAKSIKAQRVVKAQSRQKMVKFVKPTLQFNGKAYKGRVSLH